MQIFSVKACNFGSYEEIEFTVQNQGLTLISGPTGAGKSTLCDLVSWGLFGVTAKGGKVDEVVSWHGGTTEVWIWLEINEKKLQIGRDRGYKANDLFYGYVNTKEEIRGKDLNDTQRLINDQLGISADLYLNAAYFHEFSQSTQFFTTTAKNRKTICEQLVDLSLPIRLQSSIAESKKQLKIDLIVSQQKLGSCIDSIQTYQGLIEQLLIKEITWHEFQRAKISENKRKYDNFEKEKQNKVDKLHSEYNSISQSIDTSQDFEALIVECEVKMGQDICEECKSIKRYPELENELKNLRNKRIANDYTKDQLSYLKDNIRETKALQNTYSEALQQSEKQTNPYSDQLSDYVHQSSELHTNYNKLLKTNAQLKENIDELNVLDDCVTELRSVLVRDTISYLEDQTNQYLANYFDAEIKLTITVTDAEKLDFELAKNGYFCVYTQLSKGQRQLLKLCFGISVMKCVANRHNFRPSAVYFDEVLDGMDSEIKKKAFNLLKSLEIDYESIFVVDHSEEFKASFNNVVSVSLLNGKSSIEKV